MQVQTQMQSADRQASQQLTAEALVQRPDLLLISSRPSLGQLAQREVGGPDES